jgi:hypothetical protein
MIVRILVEYEVLGDDEYAYVEEFEVQLGDGNEIERANTFARYEAVRDLISRGIIVKSIKEISVEIC